MDLSQKQYKLLIIELTKVETDFGYSQSGNKAGIIYRTGSAITNVSDTTQTIVSQSIPTTLF